MSLKSLHTRITLGLAVAAPMALALLPTTAWASRYYSAAACLVAQSGANYYWNGAIGNMSSTEYLFIVCPIIDDNSISNSTGTTVSSRMSISSIWVDGYDNNDGPDNFTDNAHAQVCVSQFDGTAVTCSIDTYLKPASSPVTFTGAFDVRLDADDLTVLHGGNTLDYAYLAFVIPHMAAGQVSFLRGYQTF